MAVMCGGGGGFKSKYLPQKQGHPIPPYGHFFYHNTSGYKHSLHQLVVRSEHLPVVLGWCPLSPGTMVVSYSVIAR